MQPSPWLYNLLRARLPFRPTAYRAHRSDPWTIGFGHDGRLGLGTVVAGATISLEDAERLLRVDIETAAVAVLSRYVDMTHDEFNVLVALEVAGQ